MAGAVGPGDWLLCVRAASRPSKIVVGYTYYCVGLHVSEHGGHCGCGGQHEFGVLLLGLRSNGLSGSYCPDRFRPLGGQSETLTTAKPEPVPA